MNNQIRLSDEELQELIDALAYTASEIYMNEELYQRLLYLQTKRKMRNAKSVQLDQGKNPTLFNV